MRAQRNTPDCRTSLSPCLSAAVSRAAAALAAVAALLAPAAAGAGALEDQGRYLATAAGCLACHSEPGQPPYAGGAALTTQFGKLYGPNITPALDTGIGKWTEADFEHALRDGVAKGGELLYPAMPYAHYTRISDADVHALWAYFRSVVPVERKSTQNALRFPWSLRSGLVLWQGAFFKTGRYQPIAAKGDTWNRGAYLVEALGHCGECHTPRNLAQAPDDKRHLTGARVEGWYAPDISSDALSKLAGQSVDDVARLLKTGMAAGNSKTFGPMADVVHESLGQLTDADLHAMAVYLKDQPAPAKPQQAARAVPVPAERLAAGQQLYALHCASCHQADGKGIRQTAPALAGNSGVTAAQPHNVVTAVLEGFDREGNWSPMPAFAASLSDTEIADISNYVRNAWGNRGTLPVTPWAVGSLRRVAATPPNGQRTALICPNLPAADEQPALRGGPQALKRAAQDTPALQRLVRGYIAARPQATAADVVQALSGAYCNVVAAEGASTVRAATQTAEFSQRVAEALRR